jgi:hypothetical protein
MKIGWNDGYWRASHFEGYLGIDRPWKREYTTKRLQILRKYE